MDWASVGEVVKVLGPVATAGAAWFAAITAYRGLNKWRAETIGKRKAELAEAVLADFYRVEEIYRAARGPFVFNAELGPKEGVPDEVAADECFAPVRRLMEYEEFFGRFRVRRHEFAAVFGKDAAAPFDVVRQVNTDIHWATDCLLRHKEVRTSRQLSQVEQYREWRDIIFLDETNDKIAHRLSNAVSAIEATCRPAIQEAAK